MRRARRRAAGYLLGNCEQHRRAGAGAARRGERQPRVPGCLTRRRLSGVTRITRAARPLERARPRPPPVLAQREDAETIILFTEAAPAAPAGMT